VLLTLELMRRDVETFLAGATSTALDGARVVSLDDLRRGVVEAHGEPRFALDQLTGRLVEVSALGASATLTCAVGLVLEAQGQGEPVAWIAGRDELFYPPDLDESGVDLAALVVVRAGNAVAATRAAERLLRSGAFGLLVVDLPGEFQMPTAHQGRLTKLAQQHDTAVVLLTERGERSGSIGSLISLRVDASRERVGGGFGYRVRALKDKRRGPGWEQRWTNLRPPAGMK